MNTPTLASGLTPYQLARVLLKEFQEQFAVFRDCAPLAIGIDKQIIAAMPEVNRKLLRTALGIHTNSLRYLKTMEKATVRFNLNGEEADAIPDAHRAHASKSVQERIKKDAEIRKARRAAEISKLKAEADEREKAETERRHAEKLSALAARFSKVK